MEEVGGEETRPHVQKGSNENLSAVKYKEGKDSDMLFLPNFTYFRIYLNTVAKHVRLYQVQEAEQIKKVCNIHLHIYSTVSEISSILYKNTVSYCRDFTLVY